MEKNQAVYEHRSVTDLVCYPLDSGEKIIIVVFSRHSEYIPQFLCHYDDFKDFWAIGWAGPKVFWLPFIFRFVIRRWVTWNLRNLPEITYLTYDSTNMPALFRYKAYDFFYHYCFLFKQNKFWYTERSLFTFF